ncbi:helix-turn-helix transcriptional regulator [Rubrivivax sp. RP6-9]|uniref:helix-turn-helix transcriptional regulator n=1 Tax=Rubrivivax sp. RP6-9 TaxID=3415750 RepID=UPI003CC52EDD
MIDFASALMVRVLSEGMRVQGLEPPPGLEPPAAGGARVALDSKRSLVAAALQQGGWAVLPMLARGLTRFRDEPLHGALAGARSGADLLARWRRLERYIHARHRVAVEALDEGPHGGHARVRHGARQGPPPLPAEDLVVLGVLAALLQEAGWTDVRARLAGVPVWPVPDAGALAAAVHAGDTAAWSLEWAGAAPRAVAAPAIHGLAAHAGAHPSAWPDDSRWPPLARQAARLLAQDLAAPPGVDALARALGRSTRSLQRDLHGAGLSHTALLALARSRAAGAWLLHTDTAIAEIGFLCGYADQAHFSRDFRHRVGLPPAAFRAAFAGAR